jgi:hypothetical protein
MATERDRWYDVTLLSIRTCGCRARVILSTDPTHVFSPHFDRVIRLTSTEIWRHPIPEGAHTADMVRHPWISVFLKTHRTEFDHVFMMDAFDCYFHRDPFEFLNFEEMAFFEEGWTIENAGVNGPWIEECFDQTVRTKLLKFGAVCSGTMYGTPSLFLKFEAVILERHFWEHCGVDQPILNVLVHTGELQTRGIPFRIMSCTSPVLTLSNCPREIKNVDGVLEVFNGNNTVPHVVHQWKAFEDFRTLYVKRCDMTQFMKNLEEKLGIDLNWSAPMRETY